MATVEQCEQALQTLAARMAASASAQRELDFDRTLSCTVSDLGVIFGGRLRNGRLIDVARAAGRDAQVRLTLTSDDLVDLVDGRLKMAVAWATGRVRVEAGVRDLLRLRSVF